MSKNKIQSVESIINIIIKPIKLIMWFYVYTSRQLYLNLNSDITYYIKIYMYILIYLYLYIYIYIYIYTFIFPQINKKQ